MLGTILAVLGFVTAVVGPVLTAAVTNPQLASNQILQKALAYLGIIVFLAGVAHDALLKWQASNEEHLQTMVTLQKPAVKP